MFGFIASLFLLVRGILQVLGFALGLLEFLILVRVILSFVPPWQRHIAARVVMVLTEPILRPLRAVLPIGGGANIGLDFSPTLALLLIHALRLLLRL